MSRSKAVYYAIYKSIKYSFALNCIMLFIRVLITLPFKLVFRMSGPLPNLRNVDLIYNYYNFNSKYIPLLLIKRDLLFNP